MSLQEVYINRITKFLPNDPISNDEMEQYLGFVDGKPSKSKNIVLRNNGIKRRYYALTKNGEPTHSNAQVTALAVAELLKQKIKSPTLLACGTSTVDQMMPSHAVMVHGLLPQLGNIEVVSFSGVCCSGVHALKYAYLAVKSGEVESAIATGSERISSILKSTRYENEVKRLKELEKDPYISFEKDFLRWMLSDGAGAFHLENKPNENGLSLKLEWIEGVSYADRVDVCMYMGADKMEDNSFKGYVDFTYDEIANRSVMSIKQDIKLLSENIVLLGFDKLKDLLDRKNFDINTLDYFLPHMSSEFFRSKIKESLVTNGVDIPNEKWFTNLSTVGNVGAGSIYLMFEELFNSGKLKKGQKILMVVPESARFSYVFGLFTVC